METVLDRDKFSSIPEEMVLEILTASSLKILLNLSQASSRFLALSSRESLWRERVEKDFNLVKDKYEGMTFREQYISLVRIPDATKARLDQWKALEQRGIHPRPSIIDMITDPKVVQWMREKGFPEPVPPRPFSTLEDIPSQIEMEKIVQSGSVKQVDRWFRERDNGTRSEDLVDRIATSKSLDLIEWAVKTFGVNTLARRIEWKGSLVAFQYLARHGHRFGPEAINLAAKSWRWEVFLWLENLGYSPRKDAAGLALTQNNLEMLKHCLAHGYCLNSRSLEVAVSSGYIEALEWLAHRKILPLQWDIETALIIDLKEWFIQNGGEWVEIENEMEPVY